jgi:hypothetical protein
MEAAMKTRDEYVSKLKTQLDRWNADMSRWEAQGRSAGAELKQRYEKDLEALRAQREKALYQMKLLEGASATAWSELTRGADEAWDRMRASIEKARVNFEKK